MSHIDHLVYVAPDVPKAIDDLENRLGVRAAIGGRHEGLGTWNAIFSLGPATYFEILGPDPEQPPPSCARPFGVDAITHPRLVTWAAGANRLGSRVALARTACYDPGEVLSMKRQRPNGETVSWSMAVQRDAQEALIVSFGGLVPFLIDWGSRRNPAQDAPGGCKLLDLRGEHPEPDAVGRALGALGLSMKVARAERPGLIATLETPKGAVEVR